MEVEEEDTQDLECDRLSSGEEDADHVHYTDPCAKFNIRDIKRTRKLIPVAKFNIRDL